MESTRLKTELSQVQILPLALSSHPRLLRLFPVVSELWSSGVLRGLVVIAPDRLQHMGSRMKAPTGLVIWICEGTKRNHRQVEMVNDNELLVKAFIEYLRSFAIDERRLRARVQCSAEDVMTEQIRWSKITNIPVTQFTKPIVKAHKATARKSNSVIVRYSSQSLKQQLISEGKRYGLLH